MSVYIQLHGVFPFAPGLPNRGEDNEPKKIIMGNVERARISSQCMKNCWICSALFMEEFGGRKGEGNLAMRTKEHGPMARAMLLERGFSEAQADQWAMVIGAAYGALKPAKKGTLDHLTNKTLYFSSPDEEKAFVALIEQIAKEKRPAPNVKGNDLMEEAKKIRPLILRRETTAVQHGLFGRMFSDDKSLSIEGACQVSHFFSVDPLNEEGDFVSAKDDVKERGETEEDRGAGMLTTVALYANVFYGYASINKTMLLETLKDEKLVDRAIAKFVEAFFTVYPKAKGNSSAVQSRAVYGRVERGTKTPRNLAFAFEQAIKSQSVSEDAIVRLVKMADSLTNIYGLQYDEMEFFNVLTGEGGLQKLIDLARK